MAIRTVTLDELRGLIPLLGYRAVSRDANVTHATLTRFSGGAPIQTDTLKKITDALKVRVVVD